MHEELVHEMVMELHRFKGVMRPQRGNIDLKPFEIAVLHRVMHSEEEGAKAFPSKIGESLGFSRSFVAQILTRLEESDYITRSTQKSDRRMSEVVLTEKSRLLMKSVGNGFKSTISKLVEGLGEADSKELLRLIRRSADVMSEANCGNSGKEE